MVTSRIRFTAAQKAELWERWKKGKVHSDKEKFPNSLNRP
jgi:hypothetical protein